MIKKYLQFFGFYTMIIGTVISSGIYLRDISFGPAAQKIAIGGFLILLLGIFMVLIARIGRFGTKNLNIKIDEDKIFFQLLRFELIFSKKHLYVFLLIFIAITLPFASYLFSSFEPVNRLNLVSAKSTNVGGTEIFMPFPMTATIDDTGWRDSYAQPNRTHLLEDYENLVYIGEKVGTRLMCAFIMMDFDKENICAEYPTTTVYGAEWNNTPNLCAPEDDAIIQYIKDNSAYIEYGLHGVSHAMFADGYLIDEGFEVCINPNQGEWGKNASEWNHQGEFYDVAQHKPWNHTAVKDHFYVFSEISRQNNLSFPKSMVPPDHGYYYNPSSNESTTALLNQYEVKYATTHFGIISELKPKEGIDNGVLITYREWLDVYGYMVGVAPDGMACTTSIMTHFTNFYAEKPEDNRAIADEWISWFDNIKKTPDRYIPKNNAQLNSQWLYCRYADISKGEGNSIEIDTSKMPVEAYDYDLIGNLVFKIPLPPNQHISEANIDENQIVGYYEDRGYGYMILPILDRSIHTLQYRIGDSYPETYLQNDGTYNVFSFSSEKDKIDLEVEMYGTQDLKIKTLFEPTNISSTNYDVKLNSHDYDSETGILTVSLSATDVQGDRTELTIT
ncbi:MAG: hypothetical protein SVJ22_10860 [Halobacteriota archaeon]|nr:hypothetical protein [Halobacteriota archaeon]